MHLVALKDSFKAAANSLTQLYKQSSQSYNVAYQQGKLDAYEDVLAWLLSDQQDPATHGFKHVSVNRFKEFVQERIQAQQQQCHRAVSSSDQAALGGRSQPENCEMTN